MTPSRIKRILFYTHNSIGLGHAVRTLAVITGLKKLNPEIEFLVVSGTSVPQLFFHEGVEVIKLPSTKLEIDPAGAYLKPRYLNSFSLERLYDFRQRLLVGAFELFEPDVLVVEHNMTGQMNELVPLQLKKWMRRGGDLDFAMVYLCRGIMSRGTLLRIPYQNPRHRSESVNIGQLYDFIYVLEDRKVVDINQEFLGDDPELEEKIRYLGKITSKTKEELASREETLARFGLPDRPIILMTLGRFGQVREISRRLLEGLTKARLQDRYQVVMALDPYLSRDEATTMRQDALTHGARVMSFTPNLLDLINNSELVVSRAGYNTISEILLTDVRALVIAEEHAGGEQEIRAAGLPQANITILPATRIPEIETDRIFLDLLGRPIRPLGLSFDKYAIAQVILDDLETWGNRTKVGAI